MINADDAGASSDAHSPRPFASWAITGTTQLAAMRGIALSLQGDLSRPAFALEENLRRHGAVGTHDPRTYNPSREEAHASPGTCS